MTESVLCSSCFRDMGLRLDAQKIGIDDDEACPRCGTTDGSKLTKNLVESLAYRFFVRGTIHRVDYGGAPVIQMNHQHHMKSDKPTTSWLRDDIETIEDVAEIGFFYYGPRLWMVGEIEPLKALQEDDERDSVIARVLREYPDVSLSAGEHFYRLRKNPKRPSHHAEYDSPPDGLFGQGRLCSSSLPVLYASQDLQLCVHECRVTVEDEIYVATLKATRDLKLLDLTELIDDSADEFNSLDLSVHMLFLAGKHSYGISREIALAARAAGYDGLIFPSFFSLIRVGAVPFDTIYGISIRKFPHLREVAKAQSIPNLAVFNQPIANGDVEVACINRLHLSKVEYDYHFGPVDY